MKIGQRSNRHGSLTLRDGWLCIVDRTLAIAGLFLRQSNPAIKTRVGLFGCAFQIDDLPATNQMNSVGAFRIVDTGIEAHGGEFAQFVVELLAKTHELAQIERTEIKKKVPIYKFIVDTKEVYLFLLAVLFSARETG